jgi:phospholipid/cholesterol/gamma-HCH transport system substrate-binding protein
MSARKVDNVKLGLFVLAGGLFLIFSLYMIGKNRNLFSSTFTISASFYNVNGLMPGNNVRFSGIDVGTVKAISLESDTSVRVTMIIDKKVKKFIKKNSVAAVGTDGLMGNKLVNISGQPGEAPAIEEGDEILSLLPVETDEMLRTLNTTNQNIANISSDLKKITQKINNSTSLWKLLSDTLIVKDIKQAAVNIKLASHHAARAGNEFVDMTRRVKQGDGLAGTLITDTTLSRALRKSLNDIEVASSQAALMATDLKEISATIKQGKGAAGMLVSDSLMVQRLSQTLKNIESGTAKFNENMEAMRHHVLFRAYFKKMEKAEKKTENPAADQ